jgi:hypothetical protein
MSDMLFRHLTIVSACELWIERVGQLVRTDLPKRWESGKRTCENGVSYSPPPILHAGVCAPRMNSSHR